MTRQVLVVAPHPDDEVLGAGGTIHRLAQSGHQVTVAIATRGWEPLFDQAQVETVRAEAIAASELLGVDRLEFLDMPVTTLHLIPEHELNARFDELVLDVRPNVVLLPFPGDRHEDHRQVFDACMVALRPVSGREFVEEVLCYETVSETHWSAPNVESAFQPEVWVDIKDHLETKLRAMECYSTQIRSAPEARSLEAIEALSVWRGSVMHMEAAECFSVVRRLLRTTSPTLL